MDSILAITQIHTVIIEMLLDFNHEKHEHNESEA